MSNIIYDPLPDDDYSIETKNEYSSTSRTNYAFQIILFLFLLAFFGVAAYLILIGIREHDVKSYPLDFNSTVVAEKCSVKEKIIILHNFLRKMHGSAPFTDGSVVEHNDQMLTSLRLMARMNVISMNSHLVTDLTDNTEISAVMLNWWWPQCQCAYTFATGESLPSCSTSSFKTLIWDYKAATITILLPSVNKKEIEIYYPYLVEEKNIKTITKNVKKGTWEDFLTCSSKEKSLKILTDYLDKYCH